LLTVAQPRDVEKTFPSDGALTGRLNRLLAQLGKTPAAAKKPSVRSARHCARPTLCVFDCVCAPVAAEARADC
jgi:hypothetical protein